MKMRHIGYLPVAPIPWGVEDDEPEVPAASLDELKIKTPLATITVKVSINDLMTPVHAAEVLGVSRERIKQLRAENKLRTILVDGQPFVIRSEVEQRKATKVTA